MQLTLSHGARNLPYTVLVSRTFLSSCLKAPNYPILLSESLYTPNLREQCLAAVAPHSMSLALAMARAPATSPSSSNGTLYSDRKPAIIEANALTESYPPRYLPRSFYPPSSGGSPSSSIPYPLHVRAKRSKSSVCKGRDLAQLHEHRINNLEGTDAWSAAISQLHAQLQADCESLSHPSRLTYTDTEYSFAFVEYESRRDADDAYHEMHNKRMGRDDMLKIEVRAQSKSWC